MPTEDPEWRPGVAAARRYARRREGQVRFAVIDDRGRRYGWRRRETVPMASVLKVMLLAGYLQRIPGRKLRDADRALLSPMIRRSDNASATRIIHLLGADGLRRVARRAGMRDFAVGSPWGNSRTSARDQVRFMYRLERHIPDRHERYARRLLRTIEPSQRWGIPKARPRGWRIFFKGGWGSGTGSVTHQVAFLTAGEHRIALAIFITSSPNHRYGTRTIRGVARRLLRDLPAR